MSKVSRMRRKAEQRAEEMRDGKTKMQALKYLVANEVAYSEWSEAGMYNAVRKVIQAPDDQLFSKRELDDLILEAKDY